MEFKRGQLSYQRTKYELRQRILNDVKKSYIFTTVVADESGSHVLRTLSNNPSGTKSEQKKKISVSYTHLKLPTTSRV